MKLLKNFFLLFSLLICVLYACNRSLVNYGWSQLNGQLHIISSAVPIDMMLADPQVPDSLKLKLRLIKEIKSFATGKLGLKDAGNYERFYDQQGKPMLVVLTGCEPYNLKAKEWKFPFLGTVTYKGFFDFDEAKIERRKLIKDGFDTSLDEVSAWSTLGWFKDPVFSGMLSRQVGQTADVIIHEMTHATIYIRNDVEFNENLANFIGDKGALLFLESKFGKESEEYIDFNKINSDDELFGQYMVNACGRLDSLYKATMMLPDSIRKEMKRKLIANIVVNIDFLPLQLKNRYHRIVTSVNLPNNSYFMGYKRYEAKRSIFDSEFLEKSNSDLTTFINEKKKQYGAESIGK